VRGSTADFVALTQIGDQRLDPPPASAPTLPPILMQVSEPAILANPTPYCAQGFPTVECCLTGFFKCVGARFVCWAATQVGNIATMSTRVIFLISPFITIGLFVGNHRETAALLSPCRPCTCEQTRLGFALIRFAECSAHCTSDGLVSPTLSPQFFFRLVYRPCTSEQTSLGFFLRYFAVRTALCTPDGLLCAKREQSIRVRMVLPSARQRRTKGPIKVCRPKNLVGIASSTPELPAAARAMMGHSETN
jgi:hypothetical protein